MAIFQVVDRWQGDRDAAYAIERVSPGEKPIRLPFRGTKDEAQAEADRLNAFARARTD
jgi:hypothetical protein